MVSMMGLRIAMALVLALVVTAPAVARNEDTAAPLLEAMAYLDPGSDPAGLDFVDWAQLKRLYGAEGVTSASPLEERQHFLLEVARNEAVPLPLGLDRLATWPELWGWDTTDLDWQARFLDGRDVLRFGEHWDPAGFRAALKSLGYERDDSGRPEVWLPPDDEIPTEARIERVGTRIEAPELSLTFAPVTISTDGRTVVIDAYGPGPSLRQLRKASRPDLERIAKTPAGRAARAMGEVVVASVAASADFPCRWPGEQDLLAGEPDIGAIVAGLHRYEARADGYGREAAGSPASVRYVFSYRRPRQARADLEGRAALVELGAPWDPASAALSLTHARVAGKELILDVQPDSGHPGPYGNWRIVWDPFVMCGSPG
jgi:hypothetical protein